MTAVAFTAVELTLGARRVLSGVDFAIADNEFIGVFGPNGSGKTTLMRAILGLVSPASGTIRVLGRAAGGGNARIGYMPQQRSLGAGIGLRGWDFVACAWRGHRWGMSFAVSAGRREVARALETVEATALADRPLAQLSGGERQRLLLAQALLGEPRLLLLDEPLLNLDPHHQRAVVELIRRLQRARGITVLFSAHELNPLLGALDRVLYLGGGRAALGTVDEVITAPVLSRLYGSPIEVIRLGQRIFVMSGAHDVEHEEHRHEHRHHA